MMQTETVRALEDVGYTRKQAETLVVQLEKIIDNRVATKADLDVLHNETKADFNALRHETKADFNSLRHETKADMAALESRLVKKIHASKIAFYGLFFVGMVLNGGAMIAVRVFLGH